jgi:hypothetical protein
LRLGSRPRPAARQADGWRIDGEDRHVPVLDERLASACMISASPQLRVEQIE